jgi:hypothetical protein
MSTVPIEGMQPNGRRRARRRYARWAGVIALALLLSGVALTTTQHGDLHDLGVAAIGYGIGVGVAAAFLAGGWEPRRRK